MVRNYQRKAGSRQYHDYSQQSLDEAVQAVRNGMKFRRKRRPHPTKFLSAQFTVVLAQALSCLPQKLAQSKF